ncbi:cytoplasmic 60S subunit biogenesis factor ZNF622 [Antennarius striatus]|uniref:cytoplasmic 60S subunit biogenesis factor ZNF622 n=1 Tax=Antennarius striatus TaxID=241820 RepID=UPI0035B22D75
METSTRPQLPAPPRPGALGAYTCISCRVAFSDGDLQRRHYRSDWHRYNLKRKVAAMPPVSAHDFQERVGAQRAAAEQLDRGGQREACALCNKTFSSANAHRDHAHSHRHQQAERRAQRVAMETVERINQKNLEKGLGGHKLDHDARNEALQQALRGQQRASPAQGPAGATAGVTLGAAPGEEVQMKDKKPPRMVWLEEQVRRRERDEEEEEEEEEASGGEEDWEDVGEEEEDVGEEEEAMDQEGPAPVPPPRPAALPGSIPVTDCLFCPHHSRTLMKNLGHMTRVHSFFIPDVDFLVDLQGLIRHLGEKVGAGNVCLWCNERGRAFYSTEAVQSHMTDKSHCKLFTDGDAALEFADFYDFRSSYPDRKEGWDGEEEEEEEPPPDEVLECDEETLELTLPSGARVGHRSLLRYYRQRFAPQRAVALRHNQNAVGRVLRQYRALGWGGQGGPGGLQQRDMRFVQRMKSRWELKTSLKNNSIRQEHLRPQVVF